MVEAAVGLIAVGYGLAAVGRLYKLGMGLEKLPETTLDLRVRLMGLAVFGLIEGTVYAVWISAVYVAARALMRI
ncbi:MAG: hypothetical protein G01um101416_1209 [Microgenomates group bacterium Gr01-1014_16]|nr:MAG: hypothetical protein G01um101416_1209 [Microgenomates group bacterium Gr01-1014_16]